MTRVRVEPRPFDQSRRKNDVFTHSATFNRTVPACRTSVQFLKRTVPRINPIAKVEAYRTELPSLMLGLLKN